MWLEDGVEEKRTGLGVQTWQSGETEVVDADVVSEKNGQRVQGPSAFRQQTRL